MSMADMFILSWKETIIQTIHDCVIQILASYWSCRELYYTYTFSRTGIIYDDIDITQW